MDYCEYPTLDEWDSSYKCPITTNSCRSHAFDQRLKGRKNVPFWWSQFRRRILIILYLFIWRERLRRNAKLFLNVTLHIFYVILFTAIAHFIWGVKFISFMYSSVDQRYYTLQKCCQTTKNLWTIAYASVWHCVKKTL